MRRFHLVRLEDVSGVSGVGIVAEGILFSTGKVVLCWVSGHVHSVAVHDSLIAMLQVHGHGGRTKAAFIDADPSRDIIGLEELVSRLEILAGND